MTLLWQTTRFDIDLQTPKVMGIVNTTPDSFADGGQRRDTTAALRHAERLLQEGANILDIGGESTRPGATPVPLEVELARVLPVVKEAIRLQVPISVDTYKPEVMQVVLDAGADIINDIWALRQPDAQRIIANHPRCGVCLMHMQDSPMTMQQAQLGANALTDVKNFLVTHAHALIARGVEKSRIVIDYGAGFGKSLEGNFSLLANQRLFLDLDFPLLAGWSRKGSLGKVTGLAVDQRMVPSVAAALLAVERGASIVRVHDVAETVAALQVWSAMKAQEKN